MKLEDWSKRFGDLGAYSSRQPLEPAPTFRTRAVAAGWDYMERYALHLVRRGIEVPVRLPWFRAVDNGWEDPTGMVCVIIPHHDLHADASVFELCYTLDPEARCRQLEGESVESDHPYVFEVFQAWPGTPSLAAALSQELSSLRTRDGWFRWVQQDVMQLVTAMDVVSDAWAHRRYWFGLETGERAR